MVRPIILYYRHSTATCLRMSKCLFRNVIKLLSNALLKFLKSAVYAGFKKILIIPTLKLKSSSIQFCMGHLVLFDFICFLLFYIYSLFQIMLSNCYQSNVIILFFHFIFTNLSITFEKLFIVSSTSSFFIPSEIQYFK